MTASLRAQRLNSGWPVARVHPLCEVVEVLAVALPFEAVLNRLVGAPLRQRLADAQPARGGMRLPRLLVEPADPAGAPIVGAMPAEHVVHLIDQREREIDVARVSGRATESQPRAYGERIRP